MEKGRYVYDTLYQNAQATQGPIIQWLTARGIEHRAYYIVNLIWVKADRAAAVALAARSDVARIDGNPQIRVPLEPAPTMLEPVSPAAIEPGVTYIKAPDVWALGYTGQGIVVGGQDTGIQWDHPALKSHYRGWDGATASHDYNWHDAIHSGGGSCGANSPAPCDDSSHGTHTMGTAVGSDGSTNQIGVAPGAKFIGCRNMNVGNGTPATYIECFEFFLAPYPVAGTPAQGDPSKAPDVTNNSWGCPPSEGCNAASLLAAVQAQRAAGIMTVASAGNSGSSCNTVSDPIGIYDEVYTVGALNTGTDSAASFSSRGSVSVDGSNRTKPDIAAPGTSTRSAVPGNSYGSMSGTSMASPHVAGAVALLWSARPELKNQIAATEQAINDSAVHIASTACGSTGLPNNTYGYGRINILAASEQPSAGLALTPSSATQSTAAGNTVAYTLRFTNTGTLSDTFGVSLSGAQWPVTSSLLTTGVIAPNVGTPVTISVTVPITAVAYTTDLVSVKIASLATPAISATARFTTTALPSYSAALAAQVTEQSAYVGQTVQYTVRLTNTGTITDWYTINHDRSGWETTLQPSSQQLAPQAGVDILAQVTIPLTATHGETDTVRLFVTGTEHAYEVDLVTSALTYRVFLPLVLGGE